MATESELAGESEPYSKAGGGSRNTQPPNGSFIGIPSTSTKVRLTPLGAMPRRLSPWAVGCESRLEVRRNKLTAGDDRNASSMTIAAACARSRASQVIAATGRSDSRTGSRVALTVMISTRRCPSAAGGVAALCSPGAAMVMAGSMTLNTVKAIVARLQDRWFMAANASRRWWKRGELGKWDLRAREDFRHPLDIDIAARQNNRRDAIQRHVTSQGGGQTDGAAGFEHDF